MGWLRVTAEVLQGTGSLVLCCAVLQAGFPGSGVQLAQPAAHVGFPVHGAVHHSCIWLGLGEGVEYPGHGEGPEP